MFTASIIALAVLLLLCLFQLLLAFGAPFGNFAWGGQHKTLPVKLRIGSAVSIVIYAIFCLFILSKAEIWVVINNPQVLDIIVWIMFAYLVLGVFMNAISRSKPERYTMTPVASVLAICLFIIASN